MRVLFNYSQQHVSLTPSQALIQLVNSFQAGSNMSGATHGMGSATAGFSAQQQQQQQHQQQQHQHQQQQQQQGGLMNSIGTSGQFSLGASPSMAHLNLPNSPQVGNHPSPVQTSGMQAPALMAQHSQQGTSSSQGTSVSTSPNVQNKRRRPSGVKAESDEGGGVTEANGITGGGSKVKASPRVGKRQKGGPS